MDDEDWIFIVLIISALFAIAFLYTQTSVPYELEYGYSSY